MKTLIQKMSCEQQFAENNVGRKELVVGAVFNNVDNPVVRYCVHVGEFERLIGVVKG